MTKSLSHAYHALYYSYKYFYSCSCLCLVQAYDDISKEYPVTFDYLKDHFSDLTLNKEQEEQFIKIREILDFYNYFSTVNDVFEIDWRDNPLIVLTYTFLGKNFTMDECIDYAVLYSCELETIFDKWDFIISHFQNNAQPSIEEINQKYKINLNDYLELPTIQVLSSFIGKEEMLDDLLKTINNPSISFENTIFDDKIDDYSINLFLEKYNSSSFKDADLEIPMLRNGIGCEDDKTLEEIGKLKNCTRERIRQKEEKFANRAINFAVRNKLDSFIAHFINEKGYISIQDGEKEFGINLFRMLCCIYSYYTKKYTYDKKLGIIKHSDEKINKDIMNYYVKNYLEEVISINNVSLLNKYKEIVNGCFRKSDDFYILKECSKNRIYTLIADKYFPNGVRIGVDEDYLKYKECFQKEYGLEMNASKHTLSALFVREEYIVVDRGTFISRKMVGEIQESLMIKILDYINKSKQVVFYSALYSKFECELIENGIRNWYSLKALIDEKLPKEYLTKRDYISLDGKEYNTYNLISQKLQKYSINKLEFTIEELREEFKGFGDYIFYSALTSEQDNGLIWISTSRFVYYSQMEKTLIKQLKSIIYETIQVYQENFISISKLYSRMRIKHKFLLNEIHVESSYHLYNLCRYLYKSDFYFDNGYISLVTLSEKMTRERLLRTYIYSNNEISVNDISDYCVKMHIRRPDSITLFMEEYSEDYVLIDKGKYVNKGKICLEGDKLIQIKKVINALIKMLGTLETQQIQNYNIFPKIDFEWNEHLLVGIIRTFFPDEYDIENTDKRYHVTHYIIRKKVL